MTKLPRYPDIHLNTFHISSKNKYGLLVFFIRGIPKLTLLHENDRRRLNPFT